MGRGGMEALGSRRRLGSEQIRGPRRIVATAREARVNRI